MQGISPLIVRTSRAMAKQVTGSGEGNAPRRKPCQTVTVRRAAMNLADLGRVLLVAGLLIASIEASVSIGAVSPAVKPDSKALGKPATGKNREVLVKFKPQISEEETRSILHDVGAIEIGEIDGLGVKIAGLTGDSEPDEVAARLREREEADFAETNNAVKGTTAPNDPYYLNGDQWGLKRIGSEAAWSSSTGSTNDVIAVLDSGVDYTHPELAGKVIKGYDFVNDDADPMDDAGHGTAVSATAAAVTNNKLGTAGMAWGPKILAVKVLDPSLVGDTYRTAKGIVYAADHNADVINLSLVCGRSETLDEAVAYARRKGSLVVAAAGNGGADVIKYPGGSPGALNVGSTKNTARIEETGASLSGKWARDFSSTEGDWYDVARYSGGTAVYSNSAGASISFPFYGTAIYIIGTAGPIGGLADVFIDGKLAGQADFYYPNNRYQKKIFHAVSLSAATHTITIKVKGTKNGDSKGYYINVDALDVDEGSESRSTFSNFGDVIDIAAPGENLPVPWKNSYFITSGTSIAAPIVSGVAALAKATHPNLSGDELARLLMETSVRPDPQGRSVKFGAGRVDAAAAVSTPFKSFEESDSSVVFKGDWESAENGGASKERYMTSAAPGAGALFSFDGTRVSWIVKKGPSLGIASVRVDGESEREVDLFSPTETWQAIALTLGGLRPGGHTIEITVTGEKNPESTGSEIVVDAFDVISISDLDPPEAPRGLWAHRPDGNVVLGWPASSGEPAGYVIERSSDKANWTPVGFSIVTRFTDAIIPKDQNKTWHYRVSAHDSAGNRSGYSPIVSVFVPDITPPTDPRSLTALLTGKRSVKLSWSASSGPGDIAYKVERSTSTSGPWATVAQPSSNYYSETLPLSLGPWASYRVKAVRKDGISSCYSNVASVDMTAVTNDATGDGRSDLIGLYSYANATSGIWVFVTADLLGNPLNPALSPGLWWKSAPRGFDASRAKSVTGDFTGDGKTDLLSLYDYADSTSRFWLFKSRDGSFTSPSSAFYSSGWIAAKTKLASGDFDADGKDEVLAFYGYAGTRTGVFFFDQTSDGGLAYPKNVFFSPYWDLSKTRLLSVKTKGRAEVIAAYDYGGTTTGLWIFSINSNGTLNYPQRAFLSHNWEFAKSSFLTGDIHGDGKGDVLAFYDYGGTTTGAFVFSSTGSSFSYPAQVFLSSRWAHSRSTFVPGDFDGDRKADAGAVYDYGGGTTGFWIFKSTGNRLASPVKVYTTPYWNNAAARWVMPY